MLGFLTAGAGLHRRYRIGRAALKIPLSMLAGAIVAQAASAGQFAAQRYDDDFTALRAVDSSYARMKHLELGEAVRYLSVGGDLRERYEFAGSTNIGPRALGANSILLHRLLLHADLHWDAARVFVQLGNHREGGRIPAAKPTDVDRADIQQLFADYRIEWGDDALTLRAGRQELAFGASRLITARDGPNIRLAFDGARLDFQGSAWKTSAVVVRPVAILADEFDDKTDYERLLWGVYGTRAVAADDRFLADIYYLGATNNDAVFESVAGRERRHTVGLRLYGRRDEFDTDLELMLQSGSIAGQRIRAFAFATDSGWTWSDTRWNPRVGLRTDIISGDRHAGDNTLGTFNALYPNGSYFSEASILAQANLLDIALSLTLRPTSRTNFSLSANPLWRYATQDAVYSLPLAPMIDGSSSSARYIGTQFQWIGNWQCNDHVALRLALVRFESGTVVDKGGGSDLNYVQLATSVRF